MPARSSELILVDTGIWVDFLRGGKPTVKKTLSKLLETDLATTTQVVKAELLRGARSNADFERLQSNLNALHQLDITNKVWDYIYQLAYELRKKGFNIPLTDTVIAAVSCFYDVTLLHDDNHYKMAGSVVDLKQQRLR